MNVDELFRQTIFIWLQ